MVVDAFSDYTVSRLTGFSVEQLRRWDKQGFFQPERADENRRLPFSRVYSFRDVASLRVIGTLRRDHGVSLQHLKEVARELSKISDDAWRTRNLYVLNKKVVYENPQTGGRQEVVSGQKVFDTIPLGDVATKLRADVIQLTKRDRRDSGKRQKSRFVMNGEEVIKGTRIPVRSILAYIEMDLPDKRILEDYPDLTLEDIKSIRAAVGRAA